MSQQTTEPPTFKDALRQRSQGAEILGMSTIDWLIVVANRKKFILVTTLLLTAAVAIALLFTPNSFKATAVIMSPQQQQSSLAAFAAGPLGALTGPSAASQLGLKNPADLYVSMLKSQTIADEIVTRFRLRNVYKQKLASNTRLALAKHVTFTGGKDSLITIAVEDGDPTRAADMANAFVDALYKLTSRLAITDSSQRRLFFEQELKQAKDNLSEAEIALKTAQQATGLLLPAGQAEVLLRSTAQLRAEISAKEVMLHAIQSYETETNPQVQILQREISAMRDQLTDLEHKGSAASSFEVSAGKLPDTSLEYSRKLRDVRYQETLFELLAKQYEAARIDESKQAPLIQVIDRATLPDKKSGPHRTLLTLAGGLLGLVATSFYVVATHSAKVMSSDPEQSESISTLLRALRSKG